MMHGLKDHLFKVFSLKPVSYEPAGGIGMADHGIHLIESQPILHFIFISIRNRPDKPFKKADRLPVIPAVILQHKMQRRLIMRQGYQRFNAVVPAFVKDLIIKLQSFFIGLFVITVGIDPAPGNRQPEDAESHLRKQSDILLPVMIEIGPVPLGIVLKVQGMRQGFFNIPGSDIVVRPVIAEIHFRPDYCGIGNRPSLSPFTKSAFKLIRCRCPSPEESFGKLFFHTFASLFFRYSEIKKRDFPVINRPQTQRAVHYTDTP